MNEHPILFSTDMVKAILDGRKTMTRRVIKHNTIEAINQCNYAALDGDGNWIFWATKDVTGLDDFTPKAYPAGSNRGIKCPYGKPGDLMWVRETWQVCERDMLHNFVYYHKGARQEIPVCYKAEGIRLPIDPIMSQKIPVDVIPDYKDHDKNKWRPSIFMPRWASRITLEVVRVRVERLQDITNEDAKAEGLKPIRAMKAHHFTTGETFDSYRIPFESLWDSINAKRGYTWESNPFVWVVEFRKI